MESLSTPLIGVIILTLNEENNIIKCLNSVSSQSGVNCKVFLSDNRSQDATLKLIDQFGGFKLNHNLRIEQSLQISVYEHSYNAIKFYYEKYPEIEYWITIGADDQWENNNFLLDTLRIIYLKKISDNIKFCVFPKIIVSNLSNGETFDYIPRLFSNIPLIRMISYFLIPRSKQPFSIYYGLYNKSAIPILLEYLRRTEIYRSEFIDKKTRVPEAETFNSLILLKNLNYYSSKNSILRLSIGNRKREPYFDQKNKLLFFKYMNIIFQAKYIFHYYKAVRIHLPSDIRIVSMLMLPIKFIIEFNYDLSKLIKNKF